MRIRSTKPEFWRSKTIAALPWDARLVLKAVEAYVDDNGVGKDDLVLFASDAFPRDVYLQPQETYLRLQEALTLLQEHGLVVRYVYEGESLLYVDRWKEKVYLNKPAKGRFRRPDGTLEYVEAVDAESYQQIPGDSLPLPSSRARAESVSQVVRGSVSQVNSPATPGSALAPLDAAEPTTATLIAEWVDHCRERPVQRVIGQASREIKNLLAEGIAYERVRQGLAEWAGKGQHPATIPSFVSAVGNTRPSNGRQRETDDLFDRAAVRMAAREAAGQ